MTLTRALAMFLERLLLKQELLLLSRALLPPILLLLLLFRTSWLHITALLDLSLICLIITHIKNVIVSFGLTVGIDNYLRRLTAVVHRFPCRIIFVLGFPW